MKDIYIIGAGGFGREVAWLVERINANSPTWALRGFVDDNRELWGTEADGYPINGGVDWLSGQGEVWCVCAVGSARARKKIIEKASAYRNIHFATLIDPDVQMSKRVAIGEGSIVCAGNLLTVDITIGKHVILNLDCTVGHDAVLEDFVTVYPGVHLSGNTVIETCAELGTGMVIIQGKKVGAGSIVGAGAVVVKDIPEHCVAVGSPAVAMKSI